MPKKKTDVEQTGVLLTPQEGSGFREQIQRMRKKGDTERGILRSGLRTAQLPTKKRGEGFPMGM